MLRILDPKIFEDAFRRWGSGLVIAMGGILAVVRKTFCGSGYEHVRPIHILCAYATEQGIVLGQEKFARKSKEIADFPELLSPS